MTKNKRKRHNPPGVKVGFAALSPERRKAIAIAGGKAAGEKFTSERGRAIGKLSRTGAKYRQRAKLLKAAAKTPRVEKSNEGRLFFVNLTGMGRCYLTRCEGIKEARCEAYRMHGTLGDADVRKATSADIAHVSGMGGRVP